MINTGRCPKCGGVEIIRIEGTSEAYGVGNNIRMGTTIFSAVKVPRYVCLSCGYLENWVDTWDLEKLRKKYKDRREPKGGR